MAVITTYVCDVSGVSGTDKKDFVTVKIMADGTFENNTAYHSRRFCNIEKLLHKDVAIKLGFKLPQDKEVVPEVTLENKLLLLLKDYVNDIVVDSMSNNT